MRLNKYLAHSGVGTRRQSDEIIRKGKVTVNGITIDNPAYILQETDEVHYNGKLLYIQKDKVYLLMNKPKRFICDYDLEHNFSVARLLKNKLSNVVESPMPLTEHERGLILLTDDGTIVKKLKSEGHKIKQIFQVTLDKEISENEISALSSSDLIIRASHVRDQPKNIIGVEVHSTDTALIYKEIEKVGKTIEILDRTYIAGLTKKDLPRGFFRHLTKKEVIFLRHFF